MSDTGNISKATKTTKGGMVVERPARTPSVWERWLLLPGHKPEFLAPEQALPAHSTRIIALPTASLFVWPLWIALDGESLELVRLELAGRHLLKRGMEESLAILPIHSQETRQLLLAVACDEPFPGEILPPCWKEASRFEIPARLLATEGSDLLLWEEWGVLYLAFYRKEKPVWFCSARLEDLSGLVYRMALRLLSEGVLEHLPSAIRLEGIEQELTGRCNKELARAFPLAKIRVSSSVEKSLPPLLPEDAFDLPPSEAREDRRRHGQRKKLLSFITAGVLLYLLILLWGGGDLFIRQRALKRLRSEIAQVESSALKARKESERWHTFRPVMDPTTYALNLLAAVATPTEGGKVRLTLFSLEQNRLQISGEATDVTQAYAFIETLKKNPLLQEYDWNAGQPQLAGKESVKFDIEGTRPDTTHETAGAK
jgi:Tfp pilus assembly protein PilN